MSMSQGCPSFTVEVFSKLRDKSTSTAFMEFNHAVVNNPSALFVFYEGYDNDYYYPRLMNCCQLSIEPIWCKGKKRVIEIYKFITAKPEYSKYRKGFFVDKDYDLNEESFLRDFYVTSGYSVENFYISDSCMEKFLIQNFNFHLGDSQLNSIMNHFREMRQRYLEAILLFNSWYCAVKRKYGNNISNISLDSVMPKGFISCDYVNYDVVKNYSMSDIERDFQIDSYPVSHAELQSAENEIKSDLQKNLRGKYLVSFMLCFIRSMQELFKNDPTYNRHKRLLTICNDNFMTMLSQYADTDQKLVNYIKMVAA